MLHSKSQEKGGDVLEIPMNDVVIVQVLHAGQDRTWRNELIFGLVCWMRRGPIYRWLETVRTYRSTATVCQGVPSYETFSVSIVQVGSRFCRLSHYFFHGLWPE